MLAQPSSTSTTAIGGAGRVHTTCTLLHACMLRLCLSITAMHVVGTAAFMRQYLWCKSVMQCGCGHGMARQYALWRVQTGQQRTAKERAKKMYKKFRTMWVWAWHGTVIYAVDSSTSQQKMGKKREKKNVQDLFGQPENTCKVAWSMRTFTTVLAMIMHHDGADRETTDGLGKLSSLLQDMFFSALEAEEGKGSEEGRSEKG
ncbi:hypothetical protein EI94DRAFT_1701558 [Lactarius quietus]|nr:hypothetical protein EI94DRAFT_1701558 [Lactarius quietus]